MRLRVNRELNRPNKIGKSLIIFRIRLDGKRVAISSGFTIPQKDWNNNKKEIRQSNASASSINQLLNTYEDEIRGAVNEARIKKVEPTKAFITSGVSFTPIEAKEHDLLSAFESFIELNKRAKSKVTILKYGYTLAALKSVAERMKTPLTYDAIDDRFYAKLIDYLYDERKVQSGGANSYIKNLKVFFNWSTDRGFNNNLAYKKFKVPSFEPDIFPLNIDEIGLLNKARLTGPHEKALDIFLFQVYTGLRFSDAQCLLRSQIDKDSIRLITRKTRDKLFIPLTVPANTILNKYSDRKPLDEFVLPRLSNQKMNVYLKQLAEDLGLIRPIVYHEQRGQELTAKTARLCDKITSHDGRRTFITYCLTKGMGAQMIMRITGHKNYSTFERYVRFTEKDISQQLKHVWKD